MFGEIACKTGDVTSWTVSLSGRMGTHETTGVLLQSYCVQEVYIWIDASINYNIGLLENFFNKCHFYSTIRLPSKNGGRVIQVNQSVCTT